MRLAAADVVLASTSPHKLAEFQRLFRDSPVRILSPSPLGCTPQVAETGATFLQNARLKAVAYARACQAWSLADDSGLEVDRLGGEPGVRSARYAGPKASDQMRNAKLLRALAGVPHERRTARFRCVIALTRPHRPVELFEGRCEGVITDRPRGASGFGYDPTFYIPEMDRTMAELSFDEKNRVSHRGRASESVIAALRSRDWRV